MTNYELAEHIIKINGKISHILDIMGDLIKEITEIKLRLIKLEEDKEKNS